MVAPALIHAHIYQWHKGRAKTGAQGTNTGAKYATAPHHPSHAKLKCTLTMHQGQLERNSTWTPPLPPNSACATRNPSGIQALGQARELCIRLLVSRGVCRWNREDFLYRVHQTPQCFVARRALRCVLLYSSSCQPAGTQTLHALHVSQYMSYRTTTPMTAIASNG